MKQLEVRLRWSPTREELVGTLAQPERSAPVFEYAAAFVERGLPLSPFRLPAELGLQELRGDFLLDPGLWGVFDDSLPDGWGKLLMDRAIRDAGRDPKTLTPLDRLAFLGERTMGALTYHPPAEPDGAVEVIDLAALAAHAHAVREGEAAALLPELLRAGGSPQGARPKVVIGLRGDELVSGTTDLPDGFEHWLVKFHGREDGDDAGAVEQTYMRMAEAAGIAVPPTRLFETSAGRFVGARRFDRLPANERRHMHTLGGLIHSNFRIPTATYDQLFKVARALTRDHAAVVECFRRMVFNVAAHVRDDHVKNFALLMDPDGTWRLSPAFDVTFAPGPGGEHTLTIDGEGADPRLEHCLAVAERHDVKRRTALEIAGQVDDAIARWRGWAAEAGCRPATIDALSRAHRCLT